MINVDSEEHHPEIESTFYENDNKNSKEFRSLNSIIDPGYFILHRHLNEKQNYILSQLQFKFI